MDTFFADFEDYMFKTHGEKKYFKTLIEDILEPLKEAVEDVTTEDVINSLFGDDKTKKSRGSAYSDLFNKLKSKVGTDLSGGSGATPIAKREAGLTADATKVYLDGINPEILDTLSSIVATEKENIKEKKKQKEQGEDGGSGILGKLLKGGLLAGGIVALLAGFTTSNEWKGTLKLAGKALTSMSGLQKGIFKFFGGVEKAFSKIGKFFTKSKALATIAKKTGISTLFSNAMKGKGMFKFLGKGLKFLKKVPFLGSIISFSFAYSRFKKGDTIGGFLEIASGIASIFPGIGTAIAIGIDSIIALRDLSKGSGKAGEFARKSIDFVKTIPKFIEDNAGKFGEWLANSMLDIVSATGNWLADKIQNLAVLATNWVEEQGGWEDASKLILTKLGAVAKMIFIDGNKWIGKVILDGLGSFFSTIWERSELGPVAKFLYNKGLDIVDNVKDKLSSFYDLMKNKVFDMIDNVKNKLMFWKDDSEKEIDEKIKTTASSRRGGRGRGRNKTITKKELDTNVKEKPTSKLADAVVTPNPITKQTSETIQENKFNKLETKAQEETNKLLKINNDLLEQSIEATIVANAEASKGVAQTIARTSGGGGGGTVNNISINSDGNPIRKTRSRASDAYNS